MRERDRELAAKKRALTKAEKRVAELDTMVKRLYEDNISDKLTDEQFIKRSCDYELEQNHLTAEVESLRQDMKQQEQKKNNAKRFIATTKKYTDLQALDVAVLREFIDRIEISATARTSKERKIHIVYNFIGVFDFEAAIEQAKANKKQRKTA